MEPTPIAQEDTRKKKTAPWGAIIGLFLILSIVVAGAYYSFTKRYQPAHTAATHQQ